MGIVRGSLADVSSAGILANGAPDGDGEIEVIDLTDQPNAEAIWSQPSGINPDRGPPQSLGVSPLHLQFLSGTSHARREAHASAGSDREIFSSAGDTKPLAPAIRADAAAPGEGTPAAKGTASWEKVTALLREKGLTPPNSQLPTQYDCEAAQTAILNGNWTEAAHQYSRFFAFDESRPPPPGNVEYFVLSARWAVANLLGGHCVDWWMFEENYLDVGERVMRVLDHLYWELTAKTPADVYAEVDTVIAAMEWLTFAAESEKPDAKSHSKIKGATALRTASILKVTATFADKMSLAFDAEKREGLERKAHEYRLRASQLLDKAVQSLKELSNGRNMEYATTLLRLWTKIIESGRLTREEEPSYKAKVAELGHRIAASAPTVEAKNRAPLKGEVVIVPPGLESAARRLETLGISLPVVGLPRIDRSFTGDSSFLSGKYARAAQQYEDDHRLYTEDRMGTTARQAIAEVLASKKTSLLEDAVFHALSLLRKLKFNTLAAKRGPKTPRKFASTLDDAYRVAWATLNSQASSANTLIYAGAVCMTAAEIADKLCFARDARTNEAFAWRAQILRELAGKCYQRARTQSGDSPLMAFDARYGEREAALADDGQPSIADEIAALRRALGHVA